MQTSEKPKRRFRCSCGKVNQFPDAGGPAHSVTVRCGACKQVCRIEIPAQKTAKESIDEMFASIGGLDGGLSAMFGGKR